jgi:hypothetical protein
MFGVVVVLAWVAVVLVLRAPRLVADAAAGRTWSGMVGGVQALLALWLTARAAAAIGVREAEPLLLVAGIGLSLVAGAVSRSAPPRITAVALAVWALWRSFVLVQSDRAEGWDLGLAGVLAVAASAVVLPLLLARGAGAIGPSGRAHLRRWLPAGGVALAFVAFSSQSGALAAYATVGWGLVACGVFLTGLLARSRPHRLLGLIGLGLCVPRVFLVDLDSTLHRIIAFIVLGGVLLWVGFSYQRFRHLIADETAEPDGDKAPAGEAKS